MRGGTDVALQLVLPAGFVVLDAEEGALVDVVSVPAELEPWWQGVRADRAGSGALLAAVAWGRVDVPGGERVATTVSLVVHLLPLPPEEPAVVVAGLHGIARARTSTAGEVCMLDLALGTAVASADVVDVLTDDGAHRAATAVVQLPVPELGGLLTLTLSTPDPADLAPCAALAAALAGRVTLTASETSGEHAT
ncbi:MAG TPA: hypothetical protein VM433_04610 [Mycobacteriales bacterium]|nr:hypothetical protein [Mycobacteriales bacterium]